MMIAWPDQWYHTSGDRIDKSEPTQMKRVAVLGAAGAYTIANADDNMAIKIAGEVTSNGTRRLGHQLVVGLEKLNSATKENLTESYKMARTYVEASVDNETATLESVMELAEDKRAVGSYVTKMKKTIGQFGEAHLKTLETHMAVVAKQLGVAPVKIRLTDLEKKAQKIVPKPTAKITANGYGGYSEFFPEGQGGGRRFRGSRDIANSGELQRLINGKRNALDIKKALDAQYTRESKLDKIIEHLEMLKTAGLIEM